MPQSNENNNKANQDNIKDDTKNKAQPADVSKGYLEM